MAAKNLAARRRAASAPRPPAAPTAETPEAELPPLPVVTIEKLEEAGQLLQQLVQENLDVFVDGAATYQDAHRRRTARPVNAAEAVQLAVALSADDEVLKAVELQRSELRGYDEPRQKEVLLAGGAATAPAFIKAARFFVALVEMPLARFEAACDAGPDHLRAEIEKDAKLLIRRPAAEGRARAAAAMAHYAAAAGVDTGKVWGLLVKTVTQAFTLMLQMAAVPDGASPPSSLIDSGESTDGTGPTSSTGSPGSDVPEALS